MIVSGGAAAAEESADAQSQSHSPIRSRAISKKARPSAIPISEGLVWHLAAQQRARASQGSTSTTGQRSVRPSKRQRRCTHMTYPVHQSWTQIGQLATRVQLTQASPSRARVSNQPARTATHSTGDLTIKDKTRPVTLQLQRYGEINDERMGHRIAFSAEGEINRHDFGMEFDMLADNRLVVGQEVKIFIETEVVEVKNPVNAGA